MQAMSTRNASRIHNKYEDLFTDLEKMYNAIKENAPGAYMRRYRDREPSPDLLHPMQDPRSAPEPPNLSYMYCSGESDSVHASVTRLSGTTLATSCTDMARGAAAVSTTQASTDNLDAASSVYSASTRSTRTSRFSELGVQHQLFSTRYDRSTHTPLYTPRTAGDSGDWESWQNFTPNDSEGSATSLEAAEPDISSQVVSLVRTVSLDDDDDDDDDESRLSLLTRSPRRERRNPDPDPPHTGPRLQCFWKQCIENLCQRLQARQAEKEAERARKAIEKEDRKREKTGRKWARTESHKSQKRREKQEHKAWEKRVQKEKKKTAWRQKHQKRLDRERLEQMRMQMAADRAAAEREGRVYRFPLD